MDQQQQKPQPPWQVFVMWAVLIFVVPLILYFISHSSQPANPGQPAIAQSPPAHPSKPTPAASKPAARPKPFDQAPRDALVAIIAKQTSPTALAPQTVLSSQADLQAHFRLAAGFRGGNETSLPVDLACRFWISWKMASGSCRS